MKIAILGANGLLATSIGLYYSKCGCQISVYGLSEPQKYSFYSFSRVNLLYDLLDYDSLKENDIIIYAAGAGIQSNLNEGADVIYGLNVVLPIRICNSLRAINYSGIFITFGSYFEIGANIEDRKYTEIELLSSQLNVPNDYAISKRILSRFMSSFKSSFRTWHFILPTIYGENEAEHRLIPYVLKSIKEHSTLSFTSGDQIRQYIYVNEIPIILFRALEVSLGSGIYNVSGAESYSVKELVLHLFKLMDISAPLDMFGKASRHDEGMKILALDDSKLYNYLNYRSNVLLKDVYMKYHLL